MAEEGGPKQTGEADELLKEELDQLGINSELVTQTRAGLIFEEGWGAFNEGGPVVRVEPVEDCNTKESRDDKPSAGGHWRPGSYQLTLETVPSGKNTLVLMTTSEDVLEVRTLGSRDCVTADPNVEWTLFQTLLSSKFPTTLKKREDQLNAMPPQRRRQLSHLLYRRAVDRLVTHSLGETLDVVVFSSGAVPTQARLGSSNGRVRLRHALSEYDYPVGTVVLGYYMDSDRLKVAVVDAKGESTLDLGVGLEELEADQEALRLALGVDKIAVTRAPRRKYRGLRPEPPRRRNPKPMDPLSVAIRKHRADRESRVVDALLVKMGRALLPRELLDEVKGASQLVIVPQGTLATLPFAALKPFLGKAHLIRKVPLWIAPSWTTLFEPTELWTELPESRLVVGNPTAPTNSKWWFPDLDGATEEALAVSLEWRTDAVLGEEATRDHIRALAPKTAVLYIASHGVADSEAPLKKSFLVLAGADDGAAFWRADEILGTPLHNTELVILSACQTGLGMANEGGIVGLARAFQVAGVPRVAISLWSVEDGPTARLMTSFGTKLSPFGKQAGLSPAQALQAAMIEAIDAKVPIVHWASFTMFGTGR